MKYFLIVAFFIFSPLLLLGQDEELVIESGDTTLIESYAKRFNPRKALLYSAVLPGLGQIYNKKYWKLPLVYGGMYFTARYGIKNWNDAYKKYRGHLFYNLEHDLAGDNDINPNTTPQLTTSQLRRIVDKARRERDFMIIVMGGVYLLQIVDAHVDAHLKEFDLNPNLQVSVEPVVEQNVVLGRQTGVALVFRF